MGKSSKDVPITTRSFFVNGTKAAASREIRPAGQQVKYGIWLNSGQILTLEQARCLGVAVGTTRIDLTGKTMKDKDSVVRRLREWGILFTEGNL